MAPAVRPELVEGSMGHHQGFDKLSPNGNPTRAVAAVTKSVLHLEQAHYAPPRYPSSAAHIS